MELRLSFRGQRVRRWKEEGGTAGRREPTTVVRRTTVHPRSHCWAEVAEG